MKIIELGSNEKIYGKAGNLNELYNSFNIAKGFIIPNEEFINFLKFNKISIDDKDIISKIMDGALPNEEKLINYFKDHDYKKVIVRSSASIEDGNSYSFAGQFESYLNIDVNELITNIKRCWASQFKSNIDVYRRNKRIGDKYNYDVLIQEMVITDISGVAFSINPTDGTEEILLEVIKGQCEDIVSGKKIPHLIHLKDDMNDDFIDKIYLQEIKDNIKRLKSIFKRDVEIEFGIKDDRFFLFQVRPITKVYFSINEYIDKRFWCCFKNNNWTLFNRSLWILGAVKYKNKNILNEVTEDITLYYPHNLHQVRGFNGDEPPLDETTINNHNEDDIKKYIDEYNEVIFKINNISNKIIDDISKNDYETFYKDLKLLIKENAILNSYEYLIGSLGNALYDSLDKDMVRRIEEWRNSQNSYFPIYDEIFNYVYNHFNIEVSYKLFREYILVDELLNICNKRLKSSTLVNRIKEREEYGFVLLNVHNKRYCNKVITDKYTIDLVRDKFENLQRNDHEDANIIRGKSTFKNGSIITGECIVVKDNTIDLKNYDLKNKILVCEITTAKDIDYIKDLKALIVNSGGVLCHSAIFSREFNIPCLMGCLSATKRINTGDMIIYNVDKEYVEIKY